MSIKLGDIDAKYIKLGSDDCKVYLGDTLLYPTTPSGNVITYTASSQLNVAQSAFTPNATAETYDSATSAGTIEFSAPVTALGREAFGWKESLISIELPNSVASIGYEAFYYCRNLTTVNIPSSVTYIDESVFYYCRSLTNITLPSSITSIPSHTFYSCRSLANVDIPSTVTSIGDSAFYQCSGFTDITIPSGVTSIGSYAFQSCSSLTGITCLATTPASLGSGAFDDSTCNIYVPCESVSAYQTAWSDYASRITCISPLVGNVITYTSKYKLAEVETPGLTTSGLGLHSFSGTSGQQLTIISHTHNSGTSAGTITFDGDVGKFGAYAFNRCSGMIEINLPTTLTEMVHSGLRECRALTGITIPNSVTLLGTSNFSNCTSLTAVTIPSSVTTIERQCFQGCSNLTGVTVEATTPPTLGQDAFKGSTCPIYVPSGSVETYKSATGWRTYTNRIQAMSL